MPSLVPLVADPARLTGALEAVWRAGDVAVVVPPDLPRTRVAALDAALDGTRELPEDAALVVLTSGSSGDPRGVVLTHGALAASTTASLERLGCDAGERWALALPSHHIAGLQVLLRARALGRDPDVIDRPGDPAAIAASPAEHVALVPTQLARMVDAGADLARFRTVLVGGGPADAGLITVARARGARLVTSYGMTETAGGCVYDGIALDGARVALDDDGRIRLGGPMRALGYLDGPDEAFREDGWFVTSDRGRLDDDGRLVVIGRIDDVIVSGGENVATRAVVTALRALPGVADAEVVGVDDREWGRRVRAVVVADDPTAPPRLAALRAGVREVLPASHAPAEVVVVAAIARDAMGKVRAVERERMALLPATETALGAPDA